MALTFTDPTLGGRVGFEAEGRGRIGGMAHARVVRERIIDLSDDAFRLLAPLSRGLVRVTVR